MASSRVPEREVQEEAKRAATANLDFCPHKYSLLIIIGGTAHLKQPGHISREIERGRFYVYFQPPITQSCLCHFLPFLYGMYWDFFFFKKEKKMPASSICRKSSRIEDVVTLTLLRCLCNFIHPTDRGCVIWRCSTISITSSLRTR